MGPSADLLAEVPLVAFDLETTGLGGPRDRIVEFGAVHFHLDGQVIGQFQQLVNPQRRIPRRTQLVHGISDAMVQEMPTVAETLPRFLEFLGPSSAILLAHNAMFDVNFLRHSIRSLRLTGFDNPVVDTMLLAQRTIPGLQRYSLQRLINALEIATRVPHRALADAMLVMQLFRHLLSLRPELRTRDQLFALAPPVANYRAPGPQVPQYVRHPQLAEAIRQQRTVTLYLEGGGSARRVIPRRLVKTKGVLCLLAYCEVSRSERTFPLDHIRELRLPS